MAILAFPLPKGRADSVDLVAFLGALTLQQFLIFAHSPWRDETQALLIAQQPLSVMFDLLHYEGHPALWYLLLKTGAGLTDSPLVLPFVQSLVALGVMALLWWASPFSTVQKVILSFGSLVFFEYGVISRSYGLGVLLFLAFVALRRTFWAWVLLALLANVALHCAILAAICALWLLMEGRWSWKGAATLAVGGLIALAIMWPAADVVRAAPLQPSWLGNLFAAFWNAQALLGLNLPGVTPFVLPLGVLIGLAALVYGGFALRQDRRFVLLYAGFALLLLTTATTVYMTSARHLGLLYILAVGFAWAKVEEGETLSWELRAWFATLAVAGLWTIAWQFTHPFSPAKPVATWARANGVLEKPWTAWRPQNGLDFTSQTGRPTYNLLKGCWNTYQRWDYNPEVKVTEAELARRINGFATATGEAYMIASELPPGVRGQRLISVGKPKQVGSSLWVYYVPGLGSGSARELPRCR
jgi:hypothetical protein